MMDLVISICEIIGPLSTIVIGVTLLLIAVGKIEV
jgi:hypothetical protein